MSKSDKYVIAMYITAGLFSMLLKQFEDVYIDIPKIFSEFKTDPKMLEYPLEKINAGILGRYFEQIAIKKNNHRIGLETGFIMPFAVIGSIFNVCRNKSTMRDLFANSLDFEHPTINGINEQTTREEGDFFYFELALNQEFSEKYPVGARQWIEMQYGIALQYGISFTGRYVYPVLAHSIYTKEGEHDRLTEYLSCPILFEQKKIALVYNRSVLDLPIITANSGVFPVFTNYMNEIQILEEQQNVWTKSVHQYLIHSLSTANLNLNIVAEKFNMSKRNLHRKLKEEGTSYQQILNNLRMELSCKYLKEKIPLTEIAFLLGFESQSAFNKFFKKQFHTPPNQFR